MNKFIKYDEISLLDLFRFFYKWKYIIIFVFFFIIIIGIVIFKSKPQDKRYINHSVFILGKTRGVLIQYPEEINTYVKSKAFMKEIKKKIGEKDFFKYLNIKKDTLKKNEDMVYKRWSNNIGFLDPKLITKSEDKQLVTAVNMIAADKIAKYHEDLLYKSFKEYYKYYKVHLKDFINEVKKVSSNPIVLPVSLPGHSFTVVNIRAKCYEPVSMKKSFKKYLVMLSFIALPFSIFLAFIIELFKRINFQVIKR